MSTCTNLADFLESGRLIYSSSSSFSPSLLLLPSSPTPLYSRFSLSLLLLSSSPPFISSFHLISTSPLFSFSSLVILFHCPPHFPFCPFSSSSSALSSLLLFPLPFPVSSSLLPSSSNLWSHFLLYCSFSSSIFSLLKYTWCRNNYVTVCM